jgi:hypothetical protein
MNFTSFTASHGTKDLHRRPNHTVLQVPEHEKIPTAAQLDDPDLVITDQRKILSAH